MLKLYLFIIILVFSTDLAEASFIWTREVCEDGVCQRVTSGDPSSIRGAAFLSSSPSLNEHLASIKRISIEEDGDFDDGSFASDGGRLGSLFGGFGSLVVDDDDDDDCVL